MKLYATTTSERASKGQGGNDYLIIDLMIGSAKDSRQVAQIELYRSNDEGCDEDEWLLQWREGDSKSDLDWGILLQGHLPRKSEQEKGKKQKGEFHCDKHAWHCGGEGAYPCPHCEKCYQEHKSGKMGGCSIPHFHD
jgi:hypothetical protein